LIIPPNFLSVRLTDDDKVAFTKVMQAAEKSIGISLSAADFYRLAVNALAEKMNVKTTR
jgi:hypothetical protein